MTFQQFLEKYNGKPVDFDGYYGAQCMDLMHQYIYDVLKLTDKRILAAPSAKDVYINYPNTPGSLYFDKIDNTPTGVPNEGDIIFWGTKIGQYGHVAIFIEGNANKFRSFDQNFPIGSLPHIQEHSYNGCLGWLRFKDTIPSDDLIKQRADAFVAVCTALDKPTDKDIVLADIERLLTLEKTLTDRDKTITELNQQIKDITNTADELKKKAEQLSKDNEIQQGKLVTLTKTAEDQKTKIDNMTIQITKLQKIQPIKPSDIEVIVDFFKRLFSRFRR